MLFFVHQFPLLFYLLIVVMWYILWYVIFCMTEIEIKPRMIFVDYLIPFQLLGYHACCCNNTSRQNQQNGMCAQQRLWSAWRNIRSLATKLSTQRRLWSDWADAQANLSIRWAHSHFVGFVMRRLISSFHLGHSEYHTYMESQSSRPIQSLTVFPPLLFFFFSCLLGQHRIHLTNSFVTNWITRLSLLRPFKIFSYTIV